MTPEIVVLALAKAPRAVWAVLIFNALWFALPIAALAICIARPAAAQAAGSRFGFAV